MILTDRNKITIPQWLGMIYDEMEKLNKKLDKMTKNATDKPSSKKGKEQQS